MIMITLKEQILAKRFIRIFCKKHVQETFSYRSRLELIEAQLI